MIQVLVKGTSHVTSIPKTGIEIFSVFDYSCTKHNTEDIFIIELRANSKYFHYNCSFHQGLYATCYIVKTMFHQRITVGVQPRPPAGARNYKLHR